MNAEELAYAIYLRRCDLDHAQPALAELAWLDPGVRDFWTAEATHILTLLEAS